MYLAWIFLYNSFRKLLAIDIFSRITTCKIFSWGKKHLPMWEDRKGVGIVKGNWTDMLSIFSGELQCCNGISKLFALGEEGWGLCIPKETKNWNSLEGAWLGQSGFSAKKTPSNGEKWKSSMCGERASYPRWHVQTVLPHNL